MAVARERQAGFSRPPKATTSQPPTERLLPHLDRAALRLHQQDVLRLEVAVDELVALQEPIVGWVRARAQEHGVSASAG
jgi:hypothetical protein